MPSPSRASRRARRSIGTAIALTCTALIGTAGAHAAVAQRPADAAGAADATAADAASPSGQAMPVGNLAGWKQTFTDDFTTNVALGQFPAAVSTKWGAYPSPWKDTSGFGTYSPLKVVSISGGVLNQKIHTEGSTSMVSALLPKVPGSSSSGQKYGRYAVRFRADPLAGYKMAWMLWPDSGGNTRNGEIDFPEKNIDSTNVWAFMHRMNATSSDDQDWFKSAIEITQWHTAVIEWKPNLVTFVYDGKELGRSTTRVPNTAMHWVLQTEVSLTSGVKPAASVSGNVQIDWVAAWAYDPSATTSSSAAKDTTPPVVAVGSPTNKATVAGNAHVSATASDASGIDQVKWFVDGVEVGWDGTGPTWSDTWDTQGTANGTHSLVAKARDTAGNWGTSPAVVVKVAN